MKHSALPWQSVKSPTGTRLIMAENQIEDKRIAQLGPNGSDTAIQKANAELIVLAVNNFKLIHEALVEARGWIDKLRDGQSSDDLNDDMKLMDEAIEKGNAYYEI